MSYKLNQPNNQLINHLGNGSYWLTNQVSQKTLAGLAPLSYLHFSELFRVLLNSGQVFKKHPFVSKLFFKIQGLLSLPVDFKENPYSKFYRVMRLRDSVDPRGRKLLILRKTMRVLNVTNLGIYRKLDAIILTLVIALPVPYKRLTKASLYAATRLKSRSSSCVNSLIGELKVSYNTKYAENFFF